jgi:levanase/fructan beta-fructosidase
LLLIGVLALSRYSESSTCDRTGLEVFAADGLTYVPMPLSPSAGDQSVRIEGSDRVTSLSVHELRSAWRSK